MWAMCDRARKDKKGHMTMKVRERNTIARKEKKGILCGSKEKRSRAVKVEKERPGVRCTPAMLSL